MIHELFGKYTYLFLDLASLFFPFILSFDKKVKFYKNWPVVIPSILISGIIFLIWDKVFFDTQIWEYNPDYIVGIKLWNMALEEYLFFFCVPYSCIFIYYCLKAYFKDYLEKPAIYIHIIFTLICFVIVVFNVDKVYTLITFLGLVIINIIYYVFFKTKNLGYFYLMILIHFVPLGIVNGYLTSIPILIYNNAENLNFRIGSIPFEDFFYSILLLILNLSIIEILSRRTKAT